MPGASVGVFASSYKVDPRPNVWLDAQDLTTMFTDDAGTQPVTANGDQVVTWKSKGSAADFTLKRTVGTATYTTNLCGPSLHGLVFSAYRGAFSDGTITKNNGGGLTLMMAVHNFRGTPSNARGTSFWFQSNQPGGYCHFNYFYYGGFNFYETMGNPRSSANFITYPGYTTAQIPNTGVVLYAVRADAQKNRVDVYINQRETPFRTVGEYGTFNLTATAMVGSATDYFRANVADFRLWCRRMDNDEFAMNFDGLKNRFCFECCHPKQTCYQPSTMFQALGDFGRH